MSADVNTGTREFILPDLGEGLTEAELISWKVEIGDEVHVDQMVVEVESAKSVVELPCPYAGQITALHAAAGDTVSAGQALLSVAEAGEDSSGANLIGYGTSEPKTRSSKKRSFGSAKRPASAPTTGSAGAPSTGIAVDTAPATATSSAQSAAAPSPVADVPAPTSTEVGSGTTVSADTASASGGTAESSTVSPVSTPLVRKLAKDHGLSAKHLVGTGSGGVVTRADVLAAIESGGADEHSAAASTSVPSSARQGERDTRTPITGLRKVVSERLTRSRQEIPEATIWLDVDATELLNTKRALEARTGEKYSLLSLVARFVVAGLKKYPIINSSIDTAAGEIVTHGDINLGLAAQTPRGLMVPVVHGADQMSLRQLRDSVSETVGKAASGKFDPSELSGGTFTLNNYGVFGVDGSAPIINLPEVAMLGLGRIKDRPWVVDGELTVRKVMYLSFVFDHRACDGQEPSQFLTFVADCIENPLSLLPEL